MQNCEMASINLSQSIGDLKADLKDHNYTLNQLTSALSEESQNKDRNGAKKALTSYIGKAVPRTEATVRRTEATITTGR